MAVAYPTPAFAQLPEALDGQYVAGVNGALTNFDQQPAVMAHQISELQDWKMRVVRCNSHDQAADFEPDMATAQATAGALLDHEGNLIEALSSRGIYFMAAGLFDRMVTSLGPIDRNATIRSLFTAAGFPITGAGGLYDTLGYGTGDAWGSSRADARRVIFDLAIFHDSNLAIGSSDVKPGPSRESTAVRTLIAGIFTFMDAMMDDYLARTGLTDSGKLVIVQPMNGGECSRELTINPWWPYVSPYGYFGQTNRDLKQGGFATAWKIATGENFYPSTDSGDTEDQVDAYTFARYEWFYQWVAEKIYNSLSPSTVLLTESIHDYRSGQWRPRFVGNPASPTVTEFNVSRRYLEARSNSTERPSATGNNNDDYDTDDACTIAVPYGQAITVGYGVPGRGATVTIAANANTATFRSGIESLPGIESADLTVEKHWSNFTPIISYYTNPSGVAMNCYHVRIGAVGSPDTKSKFKRSAGVFWTSTSGATVYQHMRGGEVDRGPALRQFVRDHVSLGRKMLIYHTPYDPRVLRLWQDNDGSTRLTRGDAETVQSFEWFRAGNHESASGAKERSFHDAGPLMIDEPLHAKFLPWFGREMRRLNGG